MAFEPSHYNNREMIYQGNANIYDDRFQTVYGEKLIPVYGTGMNDLFPANDFKAESGLTSSIPISRKRSRDSSSFNPDLSTTTAAFAFLSNDISSQMYQQQLEIDQFIDHHNENMKKDMEEMRRRNTRRLIALSHEGIIKKLKTKEDEISKIGQLNFSLEEKVKSLMVENQIWRELAQTNEATANALRINLRQVLTEAQLQQQQQQQMVKELVDDCESYCGSNYEADNRQKCGGERKMNNNENMYGTSSRDGGLCRNCGKEESCVLLLPCRHLCVCSVCGSFISVCPVCKATKSAGVIVNMN